MKTRLVACQSMPSAGGTYDMLHNMGNGLFKLLALTLFFALSLASQGQVTIVIKSIPTTTPGSDTIFITGSFNDWAVDDPNYMLERQLDGKLSYHFDSVSFPFEYKFTRGSWMKVETNKENEYLPNRELHTTELPITISASIANWQDMGGVRSMRFTAFYYFAVAFLSLVLVFIVQRTKKADPIKLWAFTTLNTFLTMVFLASVVYQLANIIWTAYVEMVYHTLLFCWGAILFVFLHSFQKDPFKKKSLWLFTPALLIGILSLLKINNFHLLAFMNNRVSGIVTGNVVIAICAMVVIAAFLMFSRRVLKAGTDKYRPITRQFVTWFFRLNVLCLFLFIYYLISFLIQLPFSTYRTYDMILVPFSGIVILEMYYLWRFPEILHERPIPPQPIAQDLVERLNEMMEKGQVFTNPNLSIADLSEMLETKPHVLSRLFNDLHGKNFRDYINSHRIQAFIVLAKDGQLEKLTFLGLAHKVGFNSKSTFNLAFKKYTNQSPRAYFKRLEEKN